ncbi:uncharacterized protein CBL_04992 [Carabus blaptoides fortunei]
MCFSPFHQMCHWGPLTALGIIKIVTAMTIHCASMWWPPQNSIGGLLNTASFMTLSGLTLFHFLSSLIHGPGHLPPKWKPDDDDVKYLQFCKVCDGYKAPRSHHCRKCEKCVLKMDHHCPWINNCVGWGNHAHFTAFLAFAVAGCAQASIILSCSLYRGLNRVWYLYYGSGEEPIVYLNIYTLVLAVFALGLAVGVVLAVGMLLFFQIRAIVRNRTGIEDWILEKANHRLQHSRETFVFPYDLGVSDNIKQVLNMTCEPVGDGVVWTVAEGCDQYTLTREQIEQKNEKRQRTRLYRITNPVSGSWFPIMQGFGVCLHPPCTDEPRIRLRPGDEVNVTRWRKYWLFGDKVNGSSEENATKTRGWFPRRCAIEIIDANEETNQHNIGQKKHN